MGLGVLFEYKINASEGSELGVETLESNKDLSAD
jgi:hypothetical protein